MKGNASAAQRPADWLPRALTSGLVATTALLVTFLLTYGLATLFAGLKANTSASGQALSHWFRAVTGSPLIDLGQGTVYVVFALQLVLALAGAVVYAALEPRWRGPSWAQGLAFSVPLWLVSALVVLPLGGAGFFGTAVGGGPLVLTALLLACAVYGAVLGTVYGTFGDALLGPATSEDLLAFTQTLRTSAGGIVVGAILGALAGLLFGTALMRPGETTLAGMPLPALVLAFALVGGGLGELVGSFAGLPVAPVAAMAAQPAGVTLAAPVERARALPQLRVVAANGVCTQGYKVGDRFACTSAGDVSPGLCPAARQALRPLVAAMAQGKADAPRAVACPIYDHMLVFQLDAAV